MNKILLVFFLHIVTASPQDGQITCTIPSVEPYQDTALTCYFPEDLNVTKKDFSVYHYTNDTTPDAVIDCWWMKGNLKCYVFGGYKYNKTVNTQLTLTFSNMSTTHNGTYVCQVASYRPSSFGTCQVETEQFKQEGTILCNISLVQPGEDASLTCIYPEDVSVTKKDFSVYYYTEGVNPEAVLDCLWMNGILKCFENSGYKFNLTVNTQLTLNISHVMSINKGTYACQIAGYKPSSFGTCQFENGQSNDEKKIRCLMSPVQLGEDASLSCHFPEDLSVVRKDVSIYHVTKDGNQYAVVDCWWNKDKRRCTANSGYEYKKADDMTLTVTISNVTVSHAGLYVCDVAGYRSSSFGICSLPISNDIKEGNIYITDHEDNTLKIGLSVGLLLLAALVAALVTTGILLFVRHRRNGLHTSSKARWYTKEKGIEDGLPMLDSNKKANTECQNSKKVNQVTKSFQKYLEDSVKVMYPNIRRGCYFVPPIYFNKTAYNIQDFYGQCVYVPETSKLNDVRKDRAMQHVMHCLRSFAQHDEEQMFVLTQFQYKDYLNNPGNNFERHSLPVPDDLPVLPNEEGEIDNAACFDFLIIHRLHGVLVGVVKAVGEDDDERKSNEQMKIERVVDEVKEAVEQLRKADLILKHLMSDQQPFSKVCHTLILPNLTRATLQRALQDHSDVVEKLRQVLHVDAFEDPTKQCLCSEHLSKHNEPWNVNKHVVRNMQTIWMWTTSNKDRDVNITDDVYLSIIARFVGPATQSTLQVPDNCERFPLPKTLCEAVSLTGDLYGRSILHQDIINRLNTESKGLLVGPPNTGKTRILTLVGGKCLSNGQNVFLVKDNYSPNDSFLSQHLIQLKQKLASGNVNGSIYKETCDLNMNESVGNFVKKVAGIKANRGNCVLLDIGHLEGIYAKTFYETLYKDCPDVQLWVSCTANSFAAILPYSKHCTEILNCPPAVVREVATTKKKTNKWEGAKTTNPTLPPTDGPPVKIIYYLWSVGNEPHDSLKCGQDVGSFLTDELLITGTDEYVSQSVRTAYLQCKDVLIIFEKDYAISEDSNFLRGLRQSGITVHAAVNNKSNDVSDDGIDSALAMGVFDMETYRIKKKVVVYVEHPHVFLTEQENKNRALTSCTSQLILVKPLVAVS